MQVVCPTCGGRGSIPDPKCLYRPMCYVGPNGESVPHVMCWTCCGQGWIGTVTIGTASEDVDVKIRFI